MSLTTTRLIVNGAAHDVTAAPETPLLYVLRDELGLNSPHFGCGLAQCGACTVIIAGRARRSCVTPVSEIGKEEVTTLEGLGTPEKLHPIQQAFIYEEAAQCGFCLSGVILSAKAALDQDPQASGADLQDALAGVLCRCFVHTRMMRAIKRYQQTLTRAKSEMVPEETGDRA
jgi:aerobic-type carbon monoxide dehydrogenase small subunit (CoxS/CutS family)